MINMDVFEWLSDCNNNLMSQVDEKQIKLGQQLAISQLQSITSDRQQPHYNLEQFQLFPSFNLHKSALTTSTHRMSQNVTNKRPRPIFVETNSVASSRYDDISPGSARDGKIALQKINEGQVFQCKCSKNKQESCPYCSDTKVIKGNSNVIKFFEYVIAFKMGVNQSYGKTKLTSSSNNKSVNQFCNQFYNNNSNNRLSTQSQYNVRQTNNSIVNTTDRMSTKSKKCGRSEIASELNNLITVPIHQNYCCDVCHDLPIVGNRYHCYDCEDYDQCEKCHLSSSHSHLLEKVDRCGKGRQLQSIVHLMTQPNAKKSLRPPPSIKKQADMSSITTRSALR